MLILQGSGGGGSTIEDYIMDYKTFGKDSYVYNNKELLYKVYKKTKYSMNDNKLNGEALEYFITTSANVGEKLSKIYGISDTDELATLETIDAVLASETAVNDIAASETACNAIVGSSTAFNIAIQSFTLMNAIASSPSCMSYIVNNKTYRNTMMTNNTMFQSIGSTLYTMVTNNWIMKKSYSGQASNGTKYMTGYTGLVFVTLGYDRGVGPSDNMSIIHQNGTKAVYLTYGSNETQLSYLPNAIESTPDAVSFDGAMATGSTYSYIYTELWSPS